MSSDDPAADDQPSRRSTAIWRYEGLLLEQPQLEIRGLWYRGGKYFIVCRGLAEGLTAREGMPIERWFELYSVIGEPPMSLVGSPPDGAREISARTLEAVAAGHGAVRTFADVNHDLALALPSAFPPFTARHALGTLVVSVERPLDEIENARLQVEVARLGMGPLAVQVITDREKHSSPAARGPGDMTIRSSRVLAGTLPQRLRWHLEDDEDFWADNRLRLMASADFLQAKDVLPGRWSTGAQTCLINATSFPTSNIRNLLSIFRTVTLAPPLDERFAGDCASLGASPKELIELMQLGRLRLVLPQPIERYPLSWLGEAAEAAPDGLLFSRRLAAATIVEARSRIPLLFPLADMRERHELLRALAGLAGRESRTEVRGWLDGLVDALSRAWRFGDLIVHRQGAKGTSYVGIAALTAAVCSRVRGIDRTIEIEHAGETVEWATALGATVCPVATPSYSEEAASELVAAFYGGTPSESLPAVTPEVHRLIGDLLVIDDDSPVVDFARAFGGADIDRFRTLVGDYASTYVVPEDLDAAVKKFNDAVRGYESRADRIKSLGLVSLGLAAAKATGMVTPEQTLIPSWRRDIVGPVGDPEARNSRTGVPSLADSSMQRTVPSLAAARARSWSPECADG